MQVKKFEAPTIQEALETIKRELGPEAIILQTKKNARGFGLLSRASVEITAAVSERSLQKKKFAEDRLPQTNREAIVKMPAEKQAEVYDKMMEKHIEKVANTTRDRVDLGGRIKAAAPGSTERKPITATRYIDIEPPQTPMRGALPKASSAIVGDGGKVVATGMPIEEEVRHLKRMIEEIKSAQDDGGAGTGAQALLSQSALSTPALQDAFEQLVVNGVDKRLALSVIRRAGFELGGDGSQNPDNVVERVASEIMESTTVEPPLSGLVSRAQRPTAGPTVIALVGPTGVGKTTTVAKIASEALLKRNMKVGLINLDNYKMAAFDQLGTYAKILNVPFRTVSGTEELQAAIKDFNALDLVIVDTAGRSQRDPGSLKETEQILATVEGLHVHLVLAVTTRDAELYDMASRFSVFRPTGIIASKLDEATIYGAIYNVTQKTKLPLLYFTTGQRVPEDIEEATRERVAALIMDL